MLERIDPSLAWELEFIPRDKFYQYAETTLDIPVSVSFDEAVHWLLRIYPELLVRRGARFVLFTRENAAVELTTYNMPF